VKPYKLETVNCPLCDSLEYKIYIKDAKELYNNMNDFFDVCECNRCKHYFTNPRPTIETIEYFYPDDAGYYAFGINHNQTGFMYEVYKQILNITYNYKLKTNINKNVAKMVFFFYKRKIRVSHIAYFIENGKLLDIGCSSGNYLKKMDTLGWSVYGTEINKKAVDYINKELGLANVTNNFFDVVNMNMVLEHIYDVNLMIQKVQKILKKNGQLMLSVPDISGFESTVYNKYAYGLQVPEHIHHFTPQTIRVLLEKNGFVVEKIIHQSVDRDLVASAGYIENKTLSKVLSCKLVRKTLVKLFISLLAFLGKTSRMSIYAGKI
jgi:2-polyprenyl-3-methyl-5-hydroxy-6-metoxy-1,4-benzoquinol methylase